ncbi:hypothetical protein L1987_03033 [Smallanthus sonchifolius]|uniref:Uncharacterized protein n=1 Tax=Smallanthus sonchifolius TaxID=185202 RepID=A0ACB9K9H4_9ASTR|nr:hypothetical protein L1987_03033 [Smallanthus sonchifolius]
MPDRCKLCSLCVPNNLLPWLCWLLLHRIFMVWVHCVLHPKHLVLHPKHLVLHTKSEIIGFYSLHAIASYCGTNQFPITVTKGVDFE